MYKKQFKSLQNWFFRSVNQILEPFLRINHRQKKINGDEDAFVELVNKKN